MIAPNDREQYQVLGNILFDDITGLGTSSFFYGMFLFLFSTAAWKFYTRRVRTLPAWITFGTTVLSFILASFYWIGYAVYVPMLVWTEITIPPTQWKFQNRLFILLRLDLALTWNRQFIQLLADAVVVWRAWVLCTNCRWLMILPSALLLGTSATTFTYIGLTTTLRGFYDYLLGGKMRFAVNNAQGALSLLTNASSTLVIGYRLWCFRKDWKRAMGNRSKWSRTQNVMLAIVESGAIYAIYQLITVVCASILFYDDTPFAYFFGVLYESHVFTTAMYPTIVYLIVHNAASIENLQDTVWKVDVDSPKRTLVQDKGAENQPTPLEAVPTEPSPAAM